MQYPDETGQKTFILKPDPKFFWFRIMPLCLFFACLSGLFLWLAFAVGGNVRILALMFAILLIWATLSLIITHLPGQGNLILTPEGFEVISRYKPHRHKYRWDEVTGFYLGMLKITVRSHVSYYDGYIVKVFFESKTAAKPQQVLNHRKYSIRNEELLTLMNDWKQRYAPNPPGVEAPPTLQIDQKLLAPFRLVKQAIINMLTGMAVPLVFGVFVVPFIIGWYLFGSTDIVVSNHTPVPLSSLKLTAIEVFPFKSGQALQIKPIPPGQQGVFTIPHFDRGFIRLSYQVGGQSDCTYIKHTECRWRNSDKIIIEGPGQFNSEITECRTKYEQKWDRLVFEDCPSHDQRFKAEGFKF